MTSPEKIANLEWDLGIADCIPCKSGKGIIFNGDFYRCRSTYNNYFWEPLIETTEDLYRRLRTAELLEDRKIIKRYLNEYA